MIVFTSPASSQRGRRAVILLGVGLVGGAICDVLWRRTYWPYSVTSLDWADATRLEAQLADAWRAAQVGGLDRVDWIWAAGKTGFGATRDQTAAEMAAFEAFTRVVRDCRDQSSGTAVVTHVTSSAGGLYEGIRNVRRDSPVTIRRPYGELKYAQEQLAQEQLGPAGLHIYRPSSVYGLIRPGRRVGLVSALVSNTLCRRTTPVTGRFDTLRDYVWAEDIADYVVDRVLEDGPDSGSLSIMASGQPTSIHEMRMVVHRATRLRVYVHCTFHASNASHITFMPDSLPDRMRVTALTTNVRRMVADALSTGSIMPHPERRHESRYAARVARV